MEPTLGSEYYGTLPLPQPCSSTKAKPPPRCAEVFRPNDGRGKFFPEASDINYMNCVDGKTLNRVVLLVCSRIVRQNKPFRDVHRGLYGMQSRQHIPRLIRRPLSFPLHLLPPHYDRQSTERNKEVIGDNWQ